MLKLSDVRAHLVGTLCVCRKHKAIQALRFRVLPIRIIRNYQSFVFGGSAKMFLDGFFPQGDIYPKWRQFGDLTNSFPKNRFPKNRFPIHNPGK